MGANGDSGGEQSTTDDWYVGEGEDDDEHGDDDDGHEDDEHDDDDECWSVDRQGQERDDCKEGISILRILEIPPDEGTGAKMQKIIINFNQV